MRKSHHLQYAVAVFCGLGLLLGCNDQPAGPGTPASEHTAGDQASLQGFAEWGGRTIEFADLAMFLEFNATDNDLGVQVFLDAEDWKRVRALDPEHQPILDIVTGAEFRELGLTELRFESAEPSPQEVLGLFPPGDYVFSGITLDGDKLEGIATLSHDLPPAPTIITPEEDEVVDPSNAVIRWGPVPGVVLFEIIVSNEESGATLDIELPPSVTSLRVPKVFFEPEAEHKVEVLAISASGNKTISETVFFTKP
jgi:hypothetical protein